MSESTGETEEDLGTAEELLSSDDEASDNDPFRHRIKMSPLRWLRTYLLTVILIPIKFFLLILTVIASWMVASISLIGLSQDEMLNQPMTGWRIKSKKISSFLGRLCFRITGFYIVETKGKLATREEAPVLVVAPHSTYFDGFAVFWADLPYIISRQENRSIPLIGKCTELSQSLFVCREDPQSRQKTVRKIVERCQDGSGWPQLMIFPEGSTSNRKALMSFKPGAFVPGKPVQPILIRYPNEVDTVTWTWNQTHGAKSVLWLTLAQPFSRASIEYLPVYTPSSEEKENPILYAANVRDVMAAALKVPTCDLNFEEVKKLYGKKYKNRKNKQE